MKRLFRTALAFLLVAAAARASHDRPNIVLFLVDDLGWQDLSVPLHVQRTPFNDRYRTPYAELLAARGVRFTNAYASAPVCTPTRTSIMTGQSPGKTHISYWTLNKDTDTTTGHPTLRPPAWRVNGLQAGEITLPGLLQQAGYRTIHVGKAHFGARDTSGADPTNLGFDVNIAGHAAGAPASYYGLQNFSLAGRQGKPGGKSAWDVPGLEPYHGKDVYLTEALAIEAGKAIRQAVADNKPFYLNFATYAVHAPIMANKEYLPHYPSLDAREAAYATMIETYDAALGSLLKTLDDLGVTDNTIIIFASDNGGLSAHARGHAPDGHTKHTHNAPLRSGKGSAYEGGVRVPMIVAWPGVTKGDRVCDTPVISHDLFPTILAMAGIAIPADYAPSVEGRDITPLIRNTPGFDASRSLFWNMPHTWGARGPGIWPFTSIRDGDWKLVYFHAGRRLELYNLARDIGETNDLALQHPEIVKKLAAKLDAWIKENDVQLSIDKQTNEPVPMPGEVATTLERPAALIPLKSLEDRAVAAGWGKGVWLDQHEAICEAVADLKPAVVLVGDSITQSWGGPGRTVSTQPGRWDKWFGDLSAINAGISGDRTQHILWRLDHGMLDGHAPKAVVLMIGTNNLPDDSAEEIAAGIRACVSRIQEQCQHVLVLAPPQRGRQADDPTRVKGQRVRELIAPMSRWPGVRVVDPTPLFLLDGGRADPAKMRGDWIHFKPDGYDALGGLIRTELHTLMGSSWSDLLDDAAKQLLLRATTCVPDERQIAWQNIEFSAFVHFGVNTFTDREWGTGLEDAAIFNPSQLDADQWVSTFKDAGMGQVIITAKHHDGFCLWPSDYTDHSVKASPWRGGEGDVVRDLTDACARHGLRFGFYLSPADLHEIETGRYGNASTPKPSTIPTPVPGRPQLQRTFQYVVDDYNRYFLNQLYELLTRYGPVSEVWFDGANPKPGTGQTYAYEAWYDLIHNLAPDAVIAIKGPDVRWVGNEAGRGRESEWSVIPLDAPPDKAHWPDMTSQDLGSLARLRGAAHLHWYPAETDTSIRPGWFYHSSQDDKVKPLSTLVDTYIASVGNNCALLLNVPPDRRGLIREPDAARLRQLGQYLARTYGTNLAAGASVSADHETPDHPASNVLDDDPDTYWTTPNWTDAATIELRLPRAQRFNRVMLCEHIRTGQRIERCAIDAYLDGRWVEIAHGTTVGAKRLLRFNAIRTDRVRVRILDSRVRPTLSRFGLFYATPVEQNTLPE